jgi:hypothetical protein
LDILQTLLQALNVAEEGPKRLTPNVRLEFRVYDVFVSKLVMFVSNRVFILRTYLQRLQLPEHVDPEIMLFS